MSVFGTIAGGAVQAGLGAINNVWAQQQQNEARRQNYLYGEMAAENADARTRALYNDFYSPQALMRQYREAGLSPSMMFGGTPGQGGTSGAQGTGASGLGTPYMPMSMIEGAQVANLMAQTEKTKAEASNIKQRTPLELKDLLAGAELKEAQRYYTEAETTGQNLVNYITDSSKEFQVNKFRDEADLLAQQYTKMIYETLTAQADSEVALKTIEDRVKSVTYENDLKVLEKAVKKVDIAKEAAEITAISQTMALNIQRIRMEYGDLLVKIQNCKNQQQAIEIDKEWKKQQTAKMWAQLGFDVKKWDQELTLKYKQFTMDCIEMCLDQVNPFE